MKKNLVGIDYVITIFTLLGENPTNWMDALVQDVNANKTRWMLGTLHLTWTKITDNSIDLLLKF